MVVMLGALAPDAVRVQLYAEPVDGLPGECREMKPAQSLAGTSGGYVFTAQIATPRPASHYTPRVVPWHPAARIPAELPLICWYPR